MLSRSLNSAAYNKSTDEDRQKERAFSHRVVGLRNWVDSYKTYKKWQHGGLLNRSDGSGSHGKQLLSSISTFVTAPNSSMSLDKLETALKQQNQIAKNKYEAYKFLHKLVSIKSKFNQVTHLMLGIHKFSFRTPFLFEFLRQSLTLL